MMITIYLDVGVESRLLKSKLSRQYIGSQITNKLGQVKAEICRQQPKKPTTTTNNTNTSSSTKPGEPFFYSPYDIVLAPRLNCIVVSDYGNQCLQFFTMKSKRFRKSVHVAFMPAGLCVEEGGCAGLVCLSCGGALDYNCCTCTTTIVGCYDHNRRDDALLLAGGYCHLMKVNLAVLFNRNNVRVLDASNCTWCVGVLDESGRTEFNEPSSISISYGKTHRDNLVFVCDMYNNAVKIVSTVDGSVLQSITQYVSYYSSSSPLVVGQQITITMEKPNIVNAEYYAKFGEVILTSPDKKNIHIIRQVAVDDRPNNFEWILVKSIGNDSLYSPFGICVNETSPSNYKMIISDTYHSNLKIIDRLEGTIDQIFGSKGKVLGQFFHPYGLCLNKRENEILVADRNNSRIQIIDYS